MEKLLIGGVLEWLFMNFPMDDQPF